MILSVLLDLLEKMTGLLLHGIDKAFHNGTVHPSFQFSRSLGAIGETVMKLLNFNLMACFLTMPLVRFMVLEFSE